MKNWKKWLVDKDMDFDELWTCIEMAVRYNLLSYENIVEEYDEPEIGTGANVYRVFKLKQRRLEGYAIKIYKFLGIYRYMKWGGTEGEAAYQ